jgi:hypothetical protein
MSQESFDPKLIALESALESLAPAAGAINRDKLFFHAGQRAASRRGWLWPCATVTLALVSAALGLVVTLGPSQRDIRIVYVPIEKEDAAASQAVERLPATEAPVLTAAAAGNQPAPLSCFHLQQLVQHWGIEALPDSSSASGGGPVNPATATLDARSGFNWPEWQTP